MSTGTVFNVTNEPVAQESDELYRDYSQLVYRTAYSVTGSPQDAEDILQGVFLWLLRRGIPSGLRQNPKGYLYRAAVNLSLNAIRSRQRQILTTEVELLDRSSQSSGFNAEEEMQKRLVDAMAQLDPRVVEMLVLRYEHDYSDAEIAQLLGKSRGVIAVTLHRARARLKKLLSGAFQMRSTS